MKPSRQHYDARSYLRAMIAAGVIIAGVVGLSGCKTPQAKVNNTREGTGWTADPAPLIWESTYTKALPTIDGKMDALWRTAKPVTVVVREALGGDHPKPVVLRALHTDDTFYMLAQWPDTTKSDMRDPYVWNPDTNRYDRPSKPDDQFAIEFPIKGDFAISMMTVMREFTADVWHWKAGRGNPAGWADDKSHVISQSPVPNAKEHRLHGGRSVYIARLMDAGTPSYKKIPAPTSRQGDVVNSFAHGDAPTGSLADVRAKGLHDGKGWTLEISRKFNTGHPDDAVIDPARDNFCAIAVLNDELYEEHSVSSLITLRFVGGPASKGPASSWNFDTNNELPPGWKAAATNPKGGLAKWRVVADEKAPSAPNVLSITRINDTSRGVFNLFWTPAIRFRDGTLKATLRANTGKVDQGGGLIWRARDPDNYYIARYNPLEGNFRLYYVRGGARNMLADAGGLNIRAGEWFTIKIVHKGEKIEGWLNGKKMLEATDRTFKEVGGVGFWTKADAMTSFDDFTVKLTR
ncbi:MAG: ethylbenzene dehydrogenase-related protein [Planctomycetia bacterium]|nr:ethylbenzene dehydrogenase-related protein [Planctomycetia bacterium]